MALATVKQHVRLNNIRFKKYAGRDDKKPLTCIEYALQFNKLAFFGDWLNFWYVSIYKEVL